MADDGPPSIHGKPSGTAKGGTVQRATAIDKPPSMQGKCSGTAQGAAVQRATTGDKPQSINGLTSRHDDRGCKSFPRAPGIMIPGIGAVS